jgi:hypothetical protein
MCPACITTLALIAAGATSTDGPTALIVKTYNEPLARRRRPVGRLRDAESAGMKTGRVTKDGCQEDHKTKRKSRCQSGF